MANDLAVDDWSRVASTGLAELIGMESQGRLSATQSKQVLAEMAESARPLRPSPDGAGSRAMTGDDLSATVDQVIADNPDAWARYCAGDDAERKKLAGFLTGQVMRATRGQADGSAVNRLLQEKSRPS